MLTKASTTGFHRLSVRASHQARGRAGKNSSAVVTVAS
ncbi:hypothetical protein GGR27_001294 [Lewinella antarctica]|uniref:Uncharacterized protein n=1 Tax=Neolewinella antarctica TaxID=442734 RepID=A0ABX0X960_9BACT|nr:hypothetical protein [Neolewinella antarctica]